MFVAGSWQCFIPSSRRNLGFRVVSTFLSYVATLEKSLEGPISGWRERGSTRFRRPEAMATVLHSLSPISPGLWAEGQTSTVFEFKYVFLCLALTLRLLMSYIYIYIYIYMELLVKPEMLTLYIYGPTFGNAETVSFYLLKHCAANRKRLFQRCQT